LWEGGLGVYMKCTSCGYACARVCACISFTISIDRTCFMFPQRANCTTVWARANTHLLLQPLYFCPLLVGRCCQSLPPLTLPAGSVLQGSGLQFCLPSQLCQARLAAVHSLLLPAQPLLRLAERQGQLLPVGLGSLQCRACHDNRRLQLRAVGVVVPQIVSSGRAPRGWGVSGSPGRGIGESVIGTVQGGWGRGGEGIGTMPQGMMSDACL